MTRRHQVAAVPGIGLDAVASPVLVFQNGVLSWANQAACRLLGLSGSDELIGESFTQRLSAEDEAALSTALVAARTSSPTQVVVSWGPRPVRLMELVLTGADTATIATMRDVTEDALHRVITGVLVGGVFILERDFTIRWVTRYTADRLHQPTEALLGVNMRDLIHPDDLDRFERSATEMRVEPGTITHLYARCRAPRMDVYWRLQLWMSYQPDEPSIDGFVVRCTASYDDVNDGNEVAALMTSEDANPTGTVFFNSADEELFRSHTAVLLLGASEENSFESFVSSIDRDHHATVRAAADSARNGEGPGLAILPVEHADGRRWVRMDTRSIFAEEGEVTGWLATLHDVTAETVARQDLEEAQQRLSKLTTQDSLTELPNRALFMQQLREAWARHKRDGHGVALLFCDLDRFKAVNDAFGNDAGDLVLKAIAARIQDCVRDTDLVARLGGDEFVVLCEAYGDDATLHAIASRIREAIEAPVVVPAGSAKVGVSIGLCTTAHLVTSAEALLAGADRAMYEAKHEGNNTRSSERTNPSGPDEDDHAIHGSADVDSPVPLALSDKPETSTHRHPRPVIERNGDATIVFNVEGLVTGWSDEAQHLYGFSPTEMLGRPAADLVADSSGAELHAAISRASTGEYMPEMASRRRSKLGAPLDVRVTLAPIPRIFIPLRTESEAGLPSGPTEALISGLPSELFKLLPGIIFRTDPAGVVLFCAGQGLSDLDITSADVVGLSLLDILNDGTSTVNILRLLAGEAEEGPCSINGRTWNYSCRPVLDDDGAVIAIDGNLTDTRGAWDDREAVARSEARFRGLVQNSSDLVAMLDVDLNISYVSPSAVRLLGWLPAGMSGTSLTAHVHPEDLPVFAERLNVSHHSDSHSPFDVRLRTADGVWRVYEMVNSNLVNDPSVGAIVINGRDVTDRRAVDAELRHRASHDNLTDLPNRASLLERVDVLLRSDGDDTASLGIVVLGLDRFRLVNDSLGHGTGDQLLMAVATRLRRAVRPTDIVARLGGDTFVVAGHRVSDPSLGRALAERLLASLEEPFEVGGCCLRVSASAGVALGDGTRDSNDLVQDADTAMNVAKQPGCDSIQLFEPSLRQRSARHLDLEQSLRQAVVRNELRVHYQPIVRLVDGRPIGVEALVRWEHPELGLIPPLDFIPLAEETGDILAIGAWVLEEATRTVAAWNSAGHDLHVAVNVSPRQLMDSTLPAFVIETIKRLGLAPDRLTLEVTESVLVDEGGASKLALTTLADHGIKLAIDDFGTGYSSLLYLRRLKVDTLKIDRSFVDGLGSDTEDDAIVDTIVGLAGTLGLNIVAEGVETDEQRRILIAKGCIVAQGYHFAKPLTKEQFETQYGGDALLPPHSSSSSNSPHRGSV